MSSDDTDAKAAAMKQQFTDAGQGHVFAHWDKCSPSEREALVSQLSRVDLARVRSVFARSLADHRAGASSRGTIEPVKAHESVLGADPSRLQRWRERGLRVAAEGQLAVVLLAGGQGTRLGSSDPKGMYDIGLPSGRTLFRLHAERLVKLGRMAAAQAEAQGHQVQVRIPWYIMTSPFTHDATRRTNAAVVRPSVTVKYFEENGFFGLDATDVMFFQQGWLPCFDPDGGIIMQSKHEVATAPDGNGGMYAALHAEGCMDDMRRRGVKHIYAFCVDNALVQVGDPVYVGFCAERGADAGAKVISKAYPEEPVGVFTRKDGKVHVVEYSELPPELATAADPVTGELRLNAANVVLHYYSVDFLARCCEPDGGLQNSLVYHVANKKVPHVSPDGSSTVTPETPNGIKLEAFIFDVYAYAGEVAFLQGERAADFAPVKNKEGAGKDSPDTARALISALHRRWIEAAGGTVEQGTAEDGTASASVGRGGGGDGLVEVAPAVSYCGEGLQARVKGVRVPAGESIEALPEEEEEEKEGFVGKDGAGARAAAGSRIKKRATPASETAASRPVTRSRKAL